MSDQQKHELVRAGQDDMPDLMTLANLLVRSGYFRDAGQQAQAVVKVLAGRELGLPPIAAMTGIHIVEGKPTLGANLYASFLRKHPHYDYRVKEASRTACEVVFLRGKTKDAEVLGTYRMTLKEATEAGLTHGKSGVKHNWKAHPDAMLFARVISQGTRIYCPDVFDAHTVYTPDELGAETETRPEVRNAIDAEFDVQEDKLEPVRAELRSLAGQITSEETRGKATAAIEASLDAAALERVRARIGKTLQAEMEARATAAASAIAPETPPAEPEPRADDRRPTDAPAPEYERGGPTEGTDRRAGEQAAPPPQQKPAPQGGPQPGPARPRAGAPNFGGGR